MLHLPILWLFAFLSVLGLFLSLWIVVPAPNFVVYPLAVGAPEVSPWLVLFNGIVLLVVLQLRSHGLKRLALGIGTIALILSLLPLVQIPWTNHQFAKEMQQQLGREVQLDKTTGLHNLRSQPFS